MTAKIERLGPLPAKAAANPKAVLKGVPWAFFLVVLFPTIVAAIYFFFIATPRYVSEAKFIVREADSKQPTSLGLVLQGAGLSAAQGDAFAVHEYMTSRDALAEIDKNGQVRRALSRPGTDAFSRVPGLFDDKSNETIFKGLKRYLTVGYSSGTGISTIRVEAFRPKDAQQLNDALLQGGERLVNRLNMRASQDAVTDATRVRDEAQLRLQTSQAALSGFRNRERFIDPASSAQEGASLLATLGTTLAGLRAERSELAASAPASPQLTVLDGRIRAYEQQISSEREKIAGSSDSLAPKIGAYESLALERQLATQALAAANVSLDASIQDAQRQRLYLERVVSPSLPDKASAPNRFRTVLTVLLTALAIYALGWLLVAGVREHKQD